MNPYCKSKFFSISKVYRIFYVVLFTQLLNCGGTREWHLHSPDNKINITISLERDNTLHYAVEYMGQTAIEKSAMGIQLSTADLSKGLECTSDSPVKRIKADYTLVSGHQLHCTNLANEKSLFFTNAEHVPLSITLRAYNNGIAFRYNLTTAQDDTAQVIAETTTFDLPVPGKAYIAPYDTIAHWAPAYETYYQTCDIGTTADANKNGWAFPLLFNTNGLWILISESDLKAGYAGMHLDANCEDGVYAMHLPLTKESDPAMTNKPFINGNVSTPWRYINISKSLSGIVESNLVTDLASPCVLDDVSWTKPGAASWGWWAGASALEYDDMKRYVDFAADMGWAYSLVDAGWIGMRNGGLKKLAAYAKSRNIGILAWYISGTRPRGRANPNAPINPFIMRDPQARKAEFAKLHKWGVKGIKVDFFVTDKPYAIQLYHDILQDAAENQLLVNFHGCTLPRGWRRTYPNLMSMEAILGCEAYRYDNRYPDNAPAHLTIAAVSRNAVGPMDYTPTAFSDNRHPHKTTYGFELALSTLFESGIIHFCDAAESYREQPLFVLNYMKNLPVVWDETKCIEGVPGEYMVLARRNGSRWYIAGINALKENKDISLDLPKLDRTISSITLITDGKNSTSFAQTSAQAADGPVTLTMLPNGGFVGVTSRQK